MRTSLNRDEGVVKFFGCYTHGPTFNVLLEWASMGNLEELFQNDKIDPPQNPIDILLLWTSYLRLLGTLATLRNLEYADKSAYQL